MEKITVLLLLFVTFWLFHSSTSVPSDRTTEEPNIESSNESEDEDDFNNPDRILLALDFDTKTNLAFILSQDRSRDEMRAILRRALDMIDHRPIADRSRRVQSYNATAKALGRVLSGDPGFGSSTSESECEVPQPKITASDSDYCDVVPRGEQMSVTSMKKILELRAAGRTYAAIANIYPKYRRDKLEHYRQIVQQGRPIVSKIKMLNQGVLSRIAEARRAGRPVHGNNIRRWGLELADQLSLSRDYFSASPTWLYKLKKNGKIGSRAVTEYISSSENNQQDEIDRRVERFLESYERTAARYPWRLIINMDQTPFNYELTNKRTLSFIGERDVLLNVDQKNKVSHSFTSQPMITRDGKVFGKLLLVMQEPKTGTFGPRVEGRVRQLEYSYKNIRVLASKSGKLSAHLIRQWIDEVLGPAVRGELRSIDTDTDLQSELETMSVDDEVFDHELNRTVVEPQSSAWRCRDRGLKDKRGSDRCYKQPHTLLVADSWSGQTSSETLGELRRRGIQYLGIPPLTTSSIQPLDVYFNRQYKKIAKRIFEESLDPRSGVAVDYVNSREGIINTHSLLWNQFASENYTDMIRYAWRNTDTHWSLDELFCRPPPRGVSEIQFDFDQTVCQHEDHRRIKCTRPAFIKCSHCGKVLCLKHFFERVCFHETHSDRAGPSYTGPSYTIDDVTMSEDTDEYDFDPDLFTNRRNRLSSTTSSTTSTTTSTTTKKPGPSRMNRELEPTWYGRSETWKK